MDQYVDTRDRCSRTDDESDRRSSDSDERTAQYVTDPQLHHGSNHRVTATEHPHTAVNDPITAANQISDDQSHLARGDMSDADVPPTLCDTDPTESERVRNLKAKAECLSGISLTDVEVTFDSPKPKQVNAKAYTEGSAIHLGPGGERHLPHELWHVVQQKRGQVSTRGRTRRQLVTDPDLEREAERAAQELERQPVASLQERAGSIESEPIRSPAIQRVRLDEQQGPSCYLFVAEAVLRGKGYNTRSLQIIEQLYPTDDNDNAVDLVGYGTTGTDDRANSIDNPHAIRLRKIRDILTQLEIYICESGTSATDIRNKLFREQYILRNNELDHIEQFIRSYSSAHGILDDTERNTLQKDVQKARFIAESLATQTALTFDFYNKDMHEIFNYLHYVQFNKSSDIVSLLENECPCVLGVVTVLEPIALTDKDRIKTQEREVKRGERTEVDLTGMQLRATPMDQAHALLIDSVSRNTTNPRQSTVVIKDPNMGDVPYRITVKQLKQYRNLSSFGAVPYRLGLANDDDHLVAITAIDTPTPNADHRHDFYKKIVD